MSKFIRFLGAICPPFGWWIASRPRGEQLFPLANDNPLTVGEHKGARKTYYADAAISTRFLAVKAGSDDAHCAVISSVLDIPLGICTDEPADIYSPVNVQLLLGADKTQRMVAAGVIAAGKPVVSNGDGKVAQLGTTAGMYWCLGYAVSTTAVDGDLVEVQPQLHPIGVNVIT